MTQSTHGLHNENKGIHDRNDERSKITSFNFQITYSTVFENAYIQNSVLIPEDTKINKLRIKWRRWMEGGNCSVARVTSSHQYTFQISFNQLTITCLHDLDQASPTGKKSVNQE